MKLGNCEKTIINAVSETFDDIYDLDTLINALNSMRLQLIKNKMSVNLEPAKKFVVRFDKDEFNDLPDGISPIELTLNEVFEYTEQEHFENEKKKAIQEFKNNYNKCSSTMNDIETAKYKIPQLQRMYDIHLKELECRKEQLANKFDFDWKKIQL